MKKIVFRTTGGQSNGFGHVYRCLSLAKAIQNIDHQIDVVFVINSELIQLMTENNFEHIVSGDFKNDYELLQELAPDLIIFDSYTADNRYLKLLKSVARLMIFDDNNDLYDSTIPDIIVNGNIHAGEVGYRQDGATEYLLGPRYLVMRENYWKKNHSNLSSKEGVLVTTGGSDPYNISVQILKSLKEIEISKKVIVGPGYSDETIKEINKLKDENTTIIMKPLSLKEYISSSKYVITACGGTVYEVLSQDTIPVIFSMADNQNIAYHYFERSGVDTLGIYPDIDYDRLIAYINTVREDQKIDKNLLKELDGAGALRVARYIIDYTNKYVI